MKFKNLTLAGAFIASITSANLFASVITYETRATTNGVTHPDYSASWNNQTSAIDSNSLSAFTNVFAPNYGNHSHLSVTFDVNTANAGNEWAFQLAPDAGFGGILLLDGVEIDVDESDLWWGNNWGATTELLAGTGLSLASGTHTLEAFWAEGCCNGGQSARFSTNDGQDWMELSVDNLNAVGVPEPTSLALLGLGLLGLGMRKKAA